MEIQININIFLFFKGDAQLKFMIQWMAASVAGCDLVYFTAGNELLVKVSFDIFVRFFYRDAYHL